MRRKVRGTVSGIYMYSAALGVKTPSRLHVLCSCACSALQQNGFSRFAKNWRNSSQSAFNNISGIYASARALRAL